MTADDPTGRLDVSVDVLTAALVVHPDEELAYREAAFLVTHPDAPVSTMADYPGWVPGVYPDTSSAANFAASAQYMEPIVWGEPPVRRRPAGYSPDCEPTFAPPKTVTDVETGGAL